MNKYLLSGFVGLVSMSFVPKLAAAPSYLALRNETGTCIYGGFTTQTVENTFGTSVMPLTFSATTTYDFYSPPLASSTSLAATDKGGGVIFMKNVSPSHANDFIVTGRMQYYDYDRATGTETLIVDTGDSTTKNVSQGQTVNWAIPNVLLPTPKTVPIGHLLHVAVTLTLVSGNPAGFGQLLYNGPKTGSTTALFPQNNDSVVWHFAPAGSTCLTICQQPDGCARLTSVAVPAQTYSVQATTNLAAPVWTIIGAGTVNANGSFSFTDPDATNYSCRFYRLVGP